MAVLISMAVFSLSMSISPGPVNFLALASGLNHGFVRSLRFVAGATLSFILLLFLTGMGLGAASDSFPTLIDGLRYIGCSYIIYIGIQVFRDSGEITESASESSAPTFLKGWLMQWLNPKAWIACLAGCSAFDVYNDHLKLTQFLSVYFCMCFIGIACWALMGRKIKSWLTLPGHVDVFNKIMGMILCVLGAALLFS